MGSDEQRIQLLIDRLHCAQTALEHQAARLAQEAAQEVINLHEIQDDLTDLSYDLGEERELKTNEEAFKWAKAFVRKACEELPTGKLQIKIMAVSSSLSGPFVLEFLKNILDEYPDYSIEVDWLLVHPACLRLAGLNSAGTKWSALGRIREKELRDTMINLSTSLKLRFTVSLSFFKNLPHWHGILLGATELLLGRAKWLWKENGPNLRVGENEYRVLTVFSPSKGLRRIDLFKQWFRFYQETAEPLDME